MKTKFSKKRLTPKWAQELVAINTHDGQRNFNRRHLLELEEKILDGRFHEAVIAIMHNGTDDLMNGQHTSMAVVNTGKAVPASVHEYFAEDGDTKEDVARVFAQYDVNKSRSRGDIAWIFGCQVGMNKWPKRCVHLCNTALGWLHGGYGAVKMSKDENAALLNANVKACEFVHRLMYEEADALPRHMLRSPVVASMIASFGKSESDAEVFWCAVRDGDMLKRSDPAFRLREYLANACVSASAHTQKKKASNKEMFAKCVHAWNAYRSGKRTDLKFYPEKSLPEVK